VRNGDQLQAGITVRNGSDHPLQLQVQAAAEGLPSLPPQAISLPVGESRWVSWPVTVPAGLAQLKWQFQASERNGKASDRLAVSQPVEPAVPVTVEQASLQRLAPSLSLPVALPPTALPGRGGLRIKLQDRLGSSLPAVRRWFADYPYHCLEQRSGGAGAGRQGSLAGDRAGAAAVSGWQRLGSLLPAG
jgi:uncharacterized protein YfaS (alpha-2-macroglobulin family)